MNFDEVYRRLSTDQSAFLFVLCASVIIVLLLVTTLLLKSRDQLNWYEQNVLEMGASPLHVRRINFIRANTEENQFFNSNTKTTSFDITKNSPNTSIPKGDLSNLFTIPKAKRGPRSMFSNLHQNQFDRGLYQFPMGDESACSSVNLTTSGSIQLSVSHDSNLNLLKMSIKHAIDLPTKREDDLPNPFMKVTLEIPDSKKPKVEHQTKIYMATASPHINEDFFFSVTTQQVAACRLEIMVYDYDQFSIDECVGYCWLTLGRINEHFEQDTATVFWAEVLPVDDGENMVIYSDIALRVTLFSSSEKALKKKKTNSKKFSRTVQFSECLTFSIPKHTLCDIFLSVELVSETGTFGIASRTFAKMRLPLHKCKDLWRAIIREEKSQARWYSFEPP